MFIKIDYREDSLKTTMNLLFKEHSHEVESVNLSLGDVILESDNHVEKVIIERKTLYDLASSIKDGRYNEQSFRLDKYSLHNHNIIYLIEGDMERYNEAKGRLEKKTLYSAIVALQYFKGFSVIRTKNINETSEFIIHYANKLQKEQAKLGYYQEYNMHENKDINPTVIIDTDNSMCRVNTKYCEVIKKEKKSNITRENIGEIMLSNIPGVSSKSAIAIMNIHKSLMDLIINLQEDENCLDNIKIESSNGQTRKITKTCIENIKQYIMYQQ
jgi:ERCC4-type nuclease